MILKAQQWTLGRIGMEINAQGGLVSAPSDVTAADPLLRVAQAGVQTGWQIGPIEALGSISVSRAAAFGRNSTKPLWAFRLATHRSPVTWSLGIEQNIGVGMTRQVRHTSSPGNVPMDTVPFSASSQFDSSSTLITSSTDLVRASDVVGAIEWRDRRASLQFVAGLQMHNLASAGAWTGVNADFDVGTGNAITLMTRWQDASMLVRSPPVSLGFRMTRWPWQGSAAKREKSSPTTSGTLHTSVIHIDISADSVHLDVYLPAGRRVAVAGDATNWQPVNMTRKSAGWWTISLHRLDGVSRLHIRSNEGEWQPIPGLPMTHDEYGGMVSLLLVPTDVSSPKP